MKIQFGETMEGWWRELPRNDNAKMKFLIYTFPHEGTMRGQQPTERDRQAKLQKKV